jgi:tRNA dimethylallyltransferase
LSKAKVLALVGPTAGGKSALAVEIASQVRAEVVGIDSTAVYRGMDVGTDKPSAEDRALVRHHMIDVVEPDQTQSVAEFQEMARAAIDEVVSRNRVPLLVGGSGLYFRAVVDPLVFPPTDSEVRSRVEEEADAPEMYRRLQSIDPEAAARIDERNSRRIVRALEVIELTGRKFSSYRTAWDRYESIYDLVPAGLIWPRAELDQRIEARVDAMIDEGLVEEVKNLEARGLRDSLTSVQAIGYAQILAFLDGTTSFENAVAEMKRRTKRFARSQETWFKADPRIRWFESDPRGASGFLREASAA